MLGKPLAALVLVAVALAAAAPALAGNGGIAPVEPASPGAERVVDIYWVIMAFSALVLLLVAVPLVVFVVRYGNRGRPRDLEGPQIRGNTKLELAWTAVPVAILFVIGAVVFYKLPGITDPAEAAEGEPARVRVESRQFYFQYVYPNGAVTVDSLRLPADRTTSLVITAPAGDVIHSFWVPALAGKRDAVPGYETTMKVRPEKVGTYKALCGEFCGLQHAAMRSGVQVLPGDEYDAWLEAEEQRQADGESDLGPNTFAVACARCHGGAGEGLIGPPLKDNPIVADAEQVEDAVRNGRQAMPAVGDGWSERQMDALLAFLQSEYAPPEETDGG